MLRVLQIVQQLLQQNRHATKRDVYYSNPAILKGELDLKRILLWCIIILHIKSLHFCTFVVLNSETKICLEKSCQMIRSVFSLCQAFLHSLQQNPSISIMHMLLRKGSSVNPSNPDSWGICIGQQASKFLATVDLMKPHAIKGVLMIDCLLDSRKGQSSTQWHLHTFPMQSVFSTCGNAIFYCFDLPVHNSCVLWRVDYGMQHSISFNLSFSKALKRWSYTSLDHCVVLSVLRLNPKSFLSWALVSQ